MQVFVMHWRDVTHCLGNSPSSGASMCHMTMDKCLYNSNQTGTNLVGSTNGEYWLGNVKNTTLELPWAQKSNTRASVKWTQTCLNKNEFGGFGNEAHLLGQWVQQPAALGLLPPHCCPTDPTVAETQYRLGLLASIGFHSFTTNGQLKVWKLTN